MPTGQHIPLGQRIPASIHAVSVSLPTMADVIGYEKRVPETVAKIKTGYPRFVVHPFLKQIERHWQDLFAQPDQPVWLTSSAKIARELEIHLNDDRAKFQAHGGVSGLRLPCDDSLNHKAKKFLQHVGGFLSSRQAEDYLVANKLNDSIAPETLFEGDAIAYIKDAISPWHGNAAHKSMILANSGMNAFYSAYRAVNAIQSPKGRHSWIKLGWLYVDTMHIIDKLAPEGAENLYHYDVFDLDSLEAQIAKRSQDFAGIVTECPTNPLIQTIDLERIRKLATKHDIHLLVDPTINSAVNVDVSPYADIIVNSQTKYAGNEGDVIIGAITATKHYSDAEQFIELAQQYVQPAYHRDAQRLAAQIEHYESLVRSSNANTRTVVDFLSSHPKISKVHWSKETRSCDNYAKIARFPDEAGCMISFELRGSMAAFYDALPMAKGPSFGLRQSIACPFIYLAHFDLLHTPEGQAYLDKAGINPELIRLSIGEEDSAQIIAALQTGFAAMKENE